VVQLRRYIGKEVYMNLDGRGAISGKIEKRKGKYYAKINSNDKLIPISSNGKNRVAFKDGVLERKIRDKPKI